MYVSTPSSPNAILEATASASDKAPPLAAHPLIVPFTQNGPAAVLLSVITSCTSSGSASVPACAATIALIGTSTVFSPDVSVRTACAVPAAPAVKVTDKAPPSAGNVAGSAENMEACSPVNATAISPDRLLPTTLIDCEVVPLRPAPNANVVLSAMIAGSADTSLIVILAYCAFLLVVSSL